MWRNFTTGRVGSLEAKQFQEVQEAVAKMTWKRRPLDQPLIQSGRTILVKIGPKKGMSSGQGESQVPGAVRVKGQAYQFTQVLVRLDNNGTIEVAERMYGLRSIIPGTYSEYFAIDLNPVSNLQIGTYALVVPVDIDMGDPGVPFDEKMFYYETVFVIVALAGTTQSKFMKITSVEDDQGTYRATEYDPQTGESIGDSVFLYNAYEIDGNNYYGALNPAFQNPCARLSPEPLKVGHWVIATEWAGSWYCIAPSPFKVECQPCGNVAESMQALYDAEGTEAAVAGIMLGG